MSPSRSLDSLRLLLLAALTLSLLPQAAGAQVIELQKTGPSENRIDLVILGDGYRYRDQPRFRAHAQRAIAHLFGRSPFKEYRGFFNITLVPVYSRERGADNGSYGPRRDTALGAVYLEGSGILVVDDSLAFEAAEAEVDDIDLLMVLVNDRIGGGTSGSLAAVAADDTGLGSVTTHELGHLLGGLADEYSAPYGNIPPCSGDCWEPNVTTLTDPERIKWRHWIEDGTPLPTPDWPEYRGLVGAFEGARYNVSGVFRPRWSCVMRSTVEFEECAACETEFCEVCREALILSIYRIVRPLDATRPEGPLSVGAGESLTFEADLPLSAPPTQEIRWEVDGRLEQRGGASFTIAAEGFGAPGQHQVELSVSDETTMVRRDMMGLLQETRRWDVTVSSTGCDDDEGCFIEGACVVAGPDPDNPCRACAPEVARTHWTDDPESRCDDGDFCNGEERCEAGVCVAGTPPCDDGRWCNGVEGCVDQRCVPGEPPCAEDGLDCTLTCDEEAQTCDAIAPGRCLVEGRCYLSGDVTLDRLGTCRSCAPERDPTRLFQAPTSACGEGEGEGEGSGDATTQGIETGCAGATPSPLAAALLASLLSLDLARRRRRAKKRG